MDASFAWFAKLGSKETREGKNTSTFASFEDETQDKGCWTKERVGSARFSASSSAGGHDGNQEGSV